jgi:putative iron-regulated protein
MNEAFIDYTKDAPTGGLINDPAFTPEAAAILAHNQKSDEADVTTGWHAVEFLLWGQDFSADGPGNRPYTDYVAGTPATDKRRAYLKAVTDMLAADLTALTADWDAARPDGYAAKFKALPAREAVGRMLNGIAVLTGKEFMSERLAVALDSGDQEDEQSCFSDTTKQDFAADMDGIMAVYHGGTDAPGLDDLLKQMNPERAAKVDALMQTALSKVKALGEPWDKVLASPQGSTERLAAEATVTALTELAKELKAAGGDLGVLVQIPGM